MQGGLGWKGLRSFVLPGQGGKMGGGLGGLGGVGFKEMYGERHERVDLFVFFWWGEMCFFLNEPQKRHFFLTKVEFLVVVLGDCSFVNLS